MWLLSHFLYQLFIVWSLPDCNWYQPIYSLALLKPEGYNLLPKKRLRSYLAVGSKSVLIWLSGSSCAPCYDQRKRTVFIARSLSENGNFFSNWGICTILPQAYSWYSEDKILQITKSWGKSAFSDRLLVHPWKKIPFVQHHFLVLFFWLITLVRYESIRSYCGKPDIGIIVLYAMWITR